MPRLRVLRYALPLIALILAGQGCLGGGGNAGPDGGVFKAIDSGMEWNQVTAVPGPKGVGSFASRNVAELEMDPSDPNTIYAGLAEAGLLFTYDGGISWQRPGDKVLLEGTIGAISVDPSDVCTVYVSKGRRLYKTEDCSRTFDAETYLDPRASVTITDVEVDWFNPKVIWMGLSNGDVVRSEDAGETWANVINGKSSVVDILIGARDSRSVLIGTSRNGYWRTVDGGGTWDNIEKQLTGNLKNADRVFSLVQDASGGVVVAATKLGLVRSFDFGANWEPVQLVSAAGEVEIRALAINPGNADEIMYVTGSTFFRSQDAGATWSTNQLPTTRRGSAMLLDPDDPAVVYVGLTAPAK